MTIREAIGRAKRLAGRLIRLIGHPVTWLVGRLAGRTRFGSALFYLFCSRSFTREQHAVLVGRLRYNTDATAPGETSALLRRNIHRLEKGLAMFPRREVFGIDYINETVACYERMASLKVDEPSPPSMELRWASAVLNEFFRVAARDAAIDGARERFARLAGPHNADSAAFLPRKPDLTEQPPLAWERLRDLATRRRSVRWFRPGPVRRDIIDRAIMVAGASPSACNRQPFLFHIFDEEPLVRKVARIPMGTGGYEDNIPGIAVIVGQLRNFFSDRDRHLIYIDGALAAMSFILALEAQGVSSCCINWPDIESREQELTDLLKLDPDERPVMCIAFGYADPNGLVASSPKKPLEQLRRYNRK